MVFGFFSKEKTPPVVKLTERATNKLAQSIDRMAALEALVKDGSDDAIRGLCKRWAVTSSKGVEDEAEKNWVVDSLVAQGARVFAPLAAHMKAAEQLSYALRVLERITAEPAASGQVSKAEAMKLIEELFASEPPGYTRFAERRIDLMRWFAEWKLVSAAEVVAHLAPYLVDFDENVRFAAIDGLSHHDGALIAPPLAAALVRPEEESGRIRKAIAVVMATHKLSLGEHVAAVAKTLETMPAFAVQDGVVVQRY